MRRSCILPAIAACALTSCGRNDPPAIPAQPVATPSATATTMTPPRAPASTATPAFPKIAERFRQALVGVTVFDGTGKLTANGSGIFVADDAKLIVDRSLVADGANGVAKTSSGAIYNISGKISSPDSRGLVVLKADATHVPFVGLDSASAPAVGGRVVIVSGPGIKALQSAVDATITTRSNDSAGDYYEVTPAVPKARSGSLVVDDRGAAVGVVTTRGDSEGTVVRPLALISQALAATESDAAATWETVALTPTPSASATATPSPSASASATPKPSASPAKRSRIVYNPPPVYPTQARRGYFPIRGSGLYRITFGPDGRTMSVQIQKSAGNQLLDNAATAGLAQWRSEPGPAWSVSIPVTFQP